MDLYSLIFDQALILIPGLYILGMILKELEFIPDKLIPAILLLFGIAGALAVMGINSKSTPNEVVAAIVQGILVTGAAVYSNQFIKQLDKDKTKGP